MCKREAALAAIDNIEYHCGFIKADPHNWSLDKEELPKDGK